MRSSKLAVLSRIARVMTILRSRHRNPGTYSMSVSTTLTELDVPSQEDFNAKSPIAHIRSAHISNRTCAVDGGRCRGVMQARGHVSTGPWVPQNGGYIRSIGRCCHGCLCEAGKVFLLTGCYVYGENGNRISFWGIFQVNVATGQKFRAGDVPTCRLAGGLPRRYERNSPHL